MVVIPSDRRRVRPGFDTGRSTKNTLGSALKYETPQGEELSVFLMGLKGFDYAR